MRCNEAAKNRKYQPKAQDGCTNEKCFVLSDQVEPLTPNDLALKIGLLSNG